MIGGSLSEETSGKEKTKQKDETGSVPLSLHPSRTSQRIVVVAVPRGQSFVKLYSIKNTLDTYVVPCLISGWTNEFIPLGGRSFMI